MRTLEVLNGPKLSTEISLNVAHLNCEMLLKLPNLDVEMQMNLQEQRDVASLRSEISWTRLGRWDIL
jgi:hypothetical protein